jgi:hypothetical protein
VSDYRQPGWTATLLAWDWFVVFGQNTPDHILVDFDAEGFGNLLSNSWTAKPWIATFHFHYGVDDSLGRALGTGFSFSLRREEPSVFALLERLFCPKLTLVDSGGVQ